MIAAAAYSRDGERRLTADGAALGRRPPAGANRSRCAPSCPTTCASSRAAPAQARVPGYARLAMRAEYRAALGRYEEALTQRNTLLRMAVPGATTPVRPVGDDAGADGTWRCRRRGQPRWRLSSGSFSALMPTSPGSRPTLCASFIAPTWPDSTKRSTGNDWPRCAGCRSTAHVHPSRAAPGRP